MTSSKEYFKEYYKNHKDKIKQQQKDRWILNRDKYLSKGKKFRDEHKDTIYERNKKYRMELKKLILDVYGDRCACCGESHIEFLTVDHINGDGAAHRKQINNRRGVGFYSWLKKNEFPIGYQILCYNCNCAKGHYGVCPHEKEKIDESVHM